MLLKGTPLSLHADDVLHIGVNANLDRFVSQVRNDTKTYPSWDAERFIKRIPERWRIDGQGRWEFAVTDVTVETINKFWAPTNEIKFFDQEAQAVYMNTLLRSKMHDVIAANTARYKEDGTVPEHSLILHDDPERRVSCYQQVAGHNSFQTDGYLLFMDMGTGKTPVVVNRIDTAVRDEKLDRLYRVLIVCPKQVRTNWASELRKFSTSNGKATILRGGPIQRFKKVIDAQIVNDNDDDDIKWSVVICSYEAVVNDFKVLSNLDWDLIVLDESWYIKNPEAKRTKACLKLRDSAKVRMCLTGTLIVNSPGDAWSQFEFLGRGYSGFISRKRFREHFSHYVAAYGDGRKIFAGMLNSQMMKERIARYSFRVTKEEVLKDLPPKTYDIMEVEMTAEQKAAYISMRDFLVVSVQDDLTAAQESGSMLAVNNILTKLLKLAQITSGFLKHPDQYDEYGNLIAKGQIDRFDPNPKVEALVACIKEKSWKSKTITWCSFTQDIKTLAARFRLEGIDAVTFYGGTADKQREENLHRFNCDSNCRVFIGNAGAGGAGLNLVGWDYDNVSDDPRAKETNTDHIVYMSQDWSPVKRGQSEDRGHRRTTRVSVRYTDLQVANTIDEVIRQRVADKREMANSIADVRDIMNTILKVSIDEL